MSKFKVGDMIIGNENADKRYTITGKGWKGKVTHSDEYTLSAVGKNGERETVFDGLKNSCFDLIQNPQSIHLTTQGNTIHAVLKEGKEVIKSAKATCSPSDEFIFEYGARLAFSRLMGEEVKKEEVKENGTIELLCIKDDRPGEWLTKGKTYFFKDGSLVYDDGFKPSASESYESWCRENPSFAKCLIIKPQVKEVKRPAKVGEWVKIVNADPMLYEGQSYSNGDCFKVIKNGVICGSDIEVDGVEDFIDGREYVVLENYQPSVPTEIDYSTIDYTKLDGAKLFEEVKRRVEENGTNTGQ